MPVDGGHNAREQAATLTLDGPRGRSQRNDHYCNDQ
jgi:hypothetical protein